jgi:hypothetical protein
MQLGFTVSNNGALSGNLAGRIGVEGPPPLNLVSDRISMSYQSSASPEFVLNCFFFGAGCRLKVGTQLPLREACVLFPSAGKPLANWAKAQCLSLP